MLIGNKSDLEAKREVAQQEATNYAQENNLMFMETSALESINVEQAFETLIHNIFDKLSSKLTTMDDKRAEIMKGQAIQLTAPIENNKKSTNNSCAC
jgi:GTPase SAR1 family protein